MLDDVIDFPITVLDGTSSINDICRRIFRSNSDRFLSVEELMTAIRKRPETVENWIGYSENKRGSPSWYFAKGEGNCLVGFLDSSGNCHESKFRDPVYACAVFIKLELENKIRSNP